jgi:hypothetical protein
MSVIFAPLLPWGLIWAGAALAVLVLGFALWRGLKGWALRALAALVLLLAVAQPSLQQEEKRPLSDIVILLDDRSASQGLSDRGAQTDAAVARLAAAVQALPNTELRRVTVHDAPKDGGTQIGAALAEALAAEPRARVAGVLVVSDGQVHDPGLVPGLPAPLQLLLTGQRSDWDRRLVIETAPAYGIIGEETRIRLKIEDEGAVPAAAGTSAELSIAIDGGAAQSYRVQVGQDLELPLTLEHGGQNVVQFTVTPAAGELTERNNAAVVQINGVRDRLRVLLVSGEPHAGERTWRNLLKSDAGVDLVHFTILRPPEKQDGVPVSELSLIAFPTQELFIDKIDQFDLIIFDRYGERGSRPASYFRNIRDYVGRGGAILISAGPEFATVESLWQTPLGEVMPARPTGRVISEAFLPRPTELGLRHPVTAGLEGAPPPSGEPEGKHWGRWLRQIELTSPTGEVVMQGANGAPLLVLSRAGKGRVALLASDHPWLWDRGYEGGGPQLELLRRIAHWEMKEPELEEEALQATVEPGSLALNITRRTMKDSVGPLSLTLPDGTTRELALPPAGPGRFALQWQAPGEGLYRLRQDDLERVVALGPASPKEFERTIASPEPLDAAVKASGGGVSRLWSGVPVLRQVTAGRMSAGPGWIGITPREAAAVTGIRVTPVLPAWGWLLLAAGLTVAAWLLEGRRRAA